VDSIPTYVIFGLVKGFRTGTLT